MALEKILKNSSGIPTGEYERIAGGTLWADSPIGSILPYGGASAPSGWMICNGASLLRASYPELFAVIGTAFGSADSTHFNIPDMRESVPKGAGLTGHTVGAHLDTDGLAVGEFLDDRVQEHQHKLGSNDGTVDGYWATNQDGSSLTSSDLRVGGSTADNPRIYAKDIISGRAGATTEVKSVGVNYIIKAKMVALPADLASGVEEVAKGLLKSVNVTSLAVDSGGNVHLGYSYTDKLPVSFVPNNPGSEIIKYQFARYGNAIYITVNRTSGTVSGKFYYYEI